MLALSALLILHDNWTYRSSFRLRSYLFSEGHIDPERPQKVGWPESTAAPRLSQESTILGGEAPRTFCTYCRRRRRLITSCNVWEIDTTRPVSCFGSDHGLFAGGGEILRKARVRRHHGPERSDSKCEDSAGRSASEVDVRCVVRGVEQHGHSAMSLNPRAAFGTFRKP